MPYECRMSVVGVSYECRNLQICIASFSKKCYDGNYKAYSHYEKCPSLFLVQK